MNRFDDILLSSGWLLVDKPQGMPSARVGNLIRRTFNFGLPEKIIQKIGHVGTLDPMATGLLIFAVNEATKFIHFISSHDQASTRVQKEYIFDVSFGQSTDSYDAEGSVTGTSEHLPCAEQLVKICQSMIGPQQQCPPVFSAIKFQGKRLCDLARRGQNPTPPMREIFVHSLELVQAAEEDAVPVATFRALVSGGTYIRSLAHDISLKAGTLGHVTSLRRTKDGMFDVSQSISLEKLLNLAHKGCISDLVPIGAVLGDIPAVPVSEQGLDGVVRGNAFRTCQFDGEAGSEPVVVKITFEQAFLGIGSVQNGMCQPRRMLSFP
ncbi:MAG: tRNA pseudouridine(55) synthase TruB [Holosporales bacterium]|jgi:tRNA pseudouridine55 synthase|nr:tRNA pseudouridine(55) synthase TruB [Holosporales bacterium]